MNDAPAETLTVFPHAARTLTAVTVDSYNEELRESEGFVGDRASGKAFRKILDNCRTKLEQHGHDDPFGNADLGASLADTLGARSATLEGLGHWWMLQDPERGAAALRDFWAEVGL